MMSKSSQGSDKSLSFDDVSNCFSLPISEAANALGVCTSVLKKICRENGLQRWPYRKFQSGTSVEEIKKYAARERNKELAQLSKVDVQGNDALTSSAVSAAFGSQPQNDTKSSLWQMSKLHGAIPPHMLQQQGSRNIQNGRPQNLPNASLSKGIAASLDEFKYGFPTSGLATASNKWWGSSSPDGYEGTIGNGVEIDEEDKKQSEQLADNGANLLVMDGEKAENEKEEGTIGPQGTGLLTAVRKTTVEEGRKILKIGVGRDHGVLKAGKKERRLLLQIFGSSLPSQWINGSS